jgi:uncharacterized protein (TIGR03437 family)
VIANAEAVPLLYAGDGQINFQCPAEGTGSLLISVESNGYNSEPFRAQFGEAAPGIFTLGEAAPGYGAIQIANTNLFAIPRVSTLPSMPAVPGDYISIYATGLGRLERDLEPGTPAPADPPIRMASRVTATIGGLEAEVAFAGLAPGFVGLSQVNARIPASVPVGDSIPLTLTVTDAQGRTYTSNTVNIAIERPH